MPIKNRNFVKPTGGLWASPVDSEFGWKEWNEQNQFRDCSQSFSLRLKENARLYVIDTLQDLESAPLLQYEYMTLIDFEALAKDYDGIWLTFEGMAETRFSTPLDLYGWDCESVLLFNDECFELI
jgi:hypothetical protein